MFESFDSIVTGIFGAGLLYGGFSIMLAFHKADADKDEKKSTVFWGAAFGTAIFIFGLRIITYWFEM